jgi:thiol-disulfide isomerase/thioredoxin
MERTGWRLVPGGLGLLAAVAIAQGAPADEERCTLSVPLGATLEWKRGAERSGQLKVKKVEAGSPAAGLGYRAGDEVLSVGDDAVSDKELRAVLDLSRSGASFRTRRKQEELLLPPLFRANQVLESNEHGLKPGDRAPTVLAFLRDGLGDALESVEGRVVLVNVWATWCGPCMAEMPMLGRLQAKYGDRGFTVLALNVDDDTSRAKSFLADNPPRFMVVLTGGMTSRQADSYRVEGIPLNVLVDRSRRLAQVRVGYAGEQHESRLSAAIETLLAADDPPVLVVRRK